MAAARPAVRSRRPPQHDLLKSLNAPRAFVDLRMLLQVVHHSEGDAELGESAYLSDEETRAFFREPHASHRPDLEQPPVPPLLPPANRRTPDHSHLPPLPEFEDLLARHNEGTLAEHCAIDEDNSERAEFAHLLAGKVPGDGSWSATNANTEEGIFNWSPETCATGSPNISHAIGVAGPYDIRKSPCRQTPGVATPSRNSNDDSDPDDTLELLRSPSLPDMKYMPEIHDPVPHHDSIVCLRPTRPPQRIPGALHRGMLAAGNASDNKPDQREIMASITTRAAAMHLNDSEFEAFIRDNNKRVQRERIESRRARTAAIRDQTAGYWTPPVRAPLETAMLPADSAANLRPSEQLVRDGSANHPAPRIQTARTGTLPGPSILSNKSSFRRERQPLRNDLKLHQQSDQGGVRPRIRGHVHFTSASTASRTNASETRPLPQDVSDQARDAEPSTNAPFQELKLERGIQGRRVKRALGSASSHVTSRSEPNQASALHKEKLRQQAADRRDERDLAELLSRHNSQLQSQQRLGARKPT